MSRSSPIRVLIVDDCALVREILREMLSADPAIEIVATASEARFALPKINQYRPDVLTLDVDMPGTSGLQFLKELMKTHPMPVIMVSALTEHGAKITLDALAAGAVDFLPKPRVDLATTLQDYSEELIAKIKMAARAKVRLPAHRAPSRVAPAMIVTKNPAARRSMQDPIIAIGASTGGTEAIAEVLTKMPLASPPILIAQHIPPMFSASFASRMNDLSELTVSEAEDGQPALAGHAYIAPGDYHLRLVREDGRLVCRLGHDAPVNRHRPSVDVLFHSVAQVAGRQAIAALLTGMGRDGAKGLKAIRDAGGQTLVQDAETSVVWGMPGEAVSIKAAEDIYPIEEIAGRLLAHSGFLDKAAVPRRA